MSVEQDSEELEWAIAALVAISGADRVDDQQFASGVADLAAVMRSKWEAGEHVPTPDQIDP